MSSSHKPARMKPSTMFTVPAEISYLSPEEMASLEQAMTLWRDAARETPRQVSRERIMLIFLLLRYTGARLGEILSLDERTDFHENFAMVRLGKTKKRGAPLPEMVSQNMRRVLQSPLASTYHGDFFHVDPGYVRRTFYARADECGLPRNRATARVLRNTRAIELLRSGVPLAVVRDLLGQSSSDLAAVYQHYTGTDAVSIVRNLALDAIQNRTSARNTFAGRIVEISMDGVMAEVVLQTASGMQICTVITVESLKNLDLHKGTPAVASIKAPHVHIQPSAAAQHVSSRNRIPVTVGSIQYTRVIAEISGQSDDGTRLCALVSSRTLEELNLTAGDRTDFIFKALSVVIHTL